MVITIFGNGILFSYQQAKKKHSCFTYSHNKKVRRLSILCIKTKIISVSVITTIATSNRCELDALENLFSRESLRLDRIETLAQSGTAIVVIMKITEGNLSFFIVLHKIIFVLTLFYRIDTFSKATNASSTRVMADLITSSSNVALRFTNNSEYANDWNPSGTCSPL